MEILINELSLTGQFASPEHFVKEGLPPLLAVMKEVDSTKDLLYKKYDFYDSKIDETTTVYDVFVGTVSRLYDEIRRFKSLLAALFENPYWENDRKHEADCSYVYNGKDFCNHSVAEACERDRMIISFIHPDFSITRLLVIKNGVEIIVNNSFDKGHYTEAAWAKGAFDCQAYCARKFAEGKLDFSRIDVKEGFSLLKKEDYGCI